MDDAQTRVIGIDAAVNGWCGKTVLYCSGDYCGWCWWHRERRRRRRDNGRGMAWSAVERRIGGKGLQMVRHQIVHHHLLLTKSSRMLRGKQGVALLHRMMMIIIIIMNVWVDKWLRRHDHGLKRKWRQHGLRLLFLVHVLLRLIHGEAVYDIYTVYSKSQ